MVELFFMVKLFFLVISLKNISIIVIDILKNILMFFMFHHIILLSKPISNHCPPPKGMFLHITNPSTTETQLGCLLSNLHVLSMPPVFILN
jgi:hypothetical protein